MNFKKLIFIIYVISFAYGQAVLTGKTIKPLAELETLEKNVIVSFIGVEGENQQGGAVNYKDAKIYSILTNNTLIEEKEIFSLDPDDSSYFFGAEKGDITGEGIEEIIFFITSPTTGTLIYSYAINPGWSLQKVHEPFYIRSKQKQPTLLSAGLATIYEDKDKEIVLSFGAPDRKVEVVNYSGELSSKTIGKKFLENNVGVITVLTPDINKDSISDLYILSNNPGPKEEQFFLSPNSKPEKAKTININKSIQDVFFFNSEEELLKVFLLEDNEVFIEEWSETFQFKGEKGKKIIGSKGNNLHVLGAKGSIVVLKIENNSIEQEKTIKPGFKNKSFNKLEHLVLNNGKILISHNDPSNLSKSEIVLRELDGPALFEEEEEKEEQKNTEQSNDTKEEKSPIAQKTEKPNQRKPADLKNENEKNKEEIKTQAAPIKKQKAQSDTTVVNVGEKHTINIQRNPEMLFLSLEKKRGPEEMTLDREKLLFNWEPKIQDIGYNRLEYQIKYNASTELEEFYENGIQTLKPKEELVIYEHSHHVFVNAKPKIKISPSTSYEVFSNKEVIVPIYISDPNPEQAGRLTLSAEPQNLEGAYIQDRKFYWTPRNKHFGENKIIFSVSDGILKDSAMITISVDTTKADVSSQTKEYAVVNKEFTHKLPLIKKATASILKGPENVRISSDGQIHWIPTKPQLGTNTVVVEIHEEKQTLLYSLEVYVNAPPVISYRPNKVEFVDLNEIFSFTLKSFEENENQSLYWNFLKGPEGMTFGEGKVIWEASLPDHHDYSIELTDTLNSDIFKGIIYVNDIPKIVSVPKTYISLGNTYKYNIKIEDKNIKGPQGQNNIIKTFLQSGPTGMTLENNEIIWTPNIGQLGPNPVEIEGYDSIETVNQEFIIYVNDVPKIISADSIRVALGDTLHHFVRAEDSNVLSSLSYGINSSLDNMLMNTKTGEILWAPLKKDLGYNTIQVSVSDQFDNLGKDMQPITILVYEHPRFLDSAFPEAYVGVEYIHKVGAENMNNQSLSEKDVFIRLLESSFMESSFDTLSYEIKILPRLEEMGTQSLVFSLDDNYLNQTIESFPIKVLTSPCETSDTTYISRNEEGIVERSSSLVQKKYYKKEKSILEKSGNLDKVKPKQYVEIEEIKRTEIIDTVFLTSSEIEKHFPQLTKALDENSTSNKLSRRELRKLKKLQKTKEKQARKAKKKKRKKPNITFNQIKENTNYNDDISFSPRPKNIPEKIDLHKITNETVRKTVLAVLEDPQTPPVQTFEKNIIKPIIDLGHSIKGDKTHISNNVWNKNKTIKYKGSGISSLNYGDSFYYPGKESFQYRAENWDGVSGKLKLTK